VYTLIRPLLFALDAERSHDLTLGLLRASWHVPGVPALLRSVLAQRASPLPTTVMGLHFPNPVGLAAGLDKNAAAVGPLQTMGFGFLELGTVTPLPQPGNPKKRLFRLPEHEAIVNRMGFNSAGLDVFLSNLRQWKRTGILGINIGKNKDTPTERAVDDYLTGLRAVYAHADYVTVTISSPNTPGLRALQDEAPLAAMLTALKTEQALLAERHERYVPLALKIAPDLADEALDAIARLLLTHRLDAVIATNTTITRPGLEREPLAQEAGGLSGRPLRSLSTHVIRRLHSVLLGQIPIIGVGGVMDADDAWEKLVAGADLVQVYSAFIYRGPGVARAIVNALAEKIHRAGAKTLQDALARSRHGAVAST
jgi:dihydroorotate dehydrogenase